MRAILVVGISLLAGTAQAGFADGNKLLDLCKTDSPILTGYVSGAVDQQWIDAAALLEDRDKQTSGSDSWWAYQTGLRKVLRGTCPPVGTILKQYDDIFCHYLEKHPENRQLDGAALLQMSLSEAWPCK